MRDFEEFWVAWGSKIKMKKWLIGNKILYRWSTESKCKRPDKIHVSHQPSPFSPSKVSGTIRILLLLLGNTIGSRRSWQAKVPKVAFTPCLLGPIGRSGALLWLASNRCNGARQRMVVLCQLIPGHYLLSLASHTSYFSPGHCTSEPTKYDYSKSQIFIFMCFKLERPT